MAPGHDAPVAPSAPVANTAEAPLAPGEIIAARSTSVWRGKPPLEVHSFDVSLHNPAAAPRWLILPAVFPYRGEVTPAPGGAECEIQTFTLGPDTVLAHGVCAHFLAVHLAAGATLALSGLRIESWWEDIPDVAKLEAILASEVLVGGAPLATIVGTAVSQGGSLRAPENAADPRATIFWHPEGSTDLAVAFEAPSLAATVVPLVKR